MSQPSHVVSGKSHLGILMMLAWPAILEQLLLTLVRYVDTAMVGSLGANATAAVAINASPTWLISSILSAIGVGYSVQVAHSIGAKDKQATARIVRQALLAVLRLLAAGNDAAMTAYARLEALWSAPQPPKENVFAVLGRAILGKMSLGRNE